MEYKGLQQKLQYLISAGYSKEEIMKLITVIPTIFRHTPEGIKLILDLFVVKNEENLKKLADNAQLII